MNRGWTIARRFVVEGVDTTDQAEAAFISHASTRDDLGPSEDALDRLMSRLTIGSPRVYDLHHRDRAQRTVGH